MNRPCGVAVWYCTVLEKETAPWPVRQTFCDPGVARLSKGDDIFVWAAVRVMDTMLKLRRQRFARSETVDDKADKSSLLFAAGRRTVQYCTAM